MLLDVSSHGGAVNGARMSGESEASLPSGGELVAITGGISLPGWTGPEGVC